MGSIRNFITPGTFYYHPFTRPAPQQRRLIAWPDGEVTEVATEFHLSFKDQLSPEDLVTYYYDSLGPDCTVRNVARDAGGASYLVRQSSLDLALFAIDALVNDYMEAENRPGVPPDLIKAIDYLQSAQDQLGRVKAIAVEYGIDERSYQHVV